MTTQNQKQAKTQSATAPAVEQVKDIAELSPEMKSLFDQAARNQGFKDISDLAASTGQPSKAE